MVLGRHFPAKAQLTTVFVAHRAIHTQHEVARLPLKREPYPPPPPPHTHKQELSSRRRCPLRRAIALSGEGAGETGIASAELCLVGRAGTFSGASLGWQREGSAVGWKVSSGRRDQCGIPCDELVSQDIGRCPTQLLTGRDG